MTSGKAGGLLGEPLKGADKTVSRPWRLRFLLPLQGEGWDGGGFRYVHLLHHQPIPTLALPLKGRELQQSLPSSHDCRISQTVEVPRHSRGFTSLNQAGCSRGQDSDAGCSRCESDTLDVYGSIRLARVAFLRNGCRSKKDTIAKLITCTVYVFLVDFACITSCV